MRNVSWEGPQSASETLEEHGGVGLSGTRSVPTTSSTWTMITTPSTQYWRRTRLSIRIENTRSRARLKCGVQKIQCKFKQDIPDMGHLDGGSERDVRVYRLSALPNIEDAVR